MKRIMWLAAACLLGGLMVATVVSGLREPARAAKVTATQMETELLQNPGFENATGGIPDHWNKCGGTLTQAGSPVHGGSHAAQFDSSSTSTKWVYQVITVTEGRVYTFSAWAL